MSFEEPRFGRVLTAMATPFDDSGNLDLDQAAVLANYLVAHGSEGLVVAGTTGESPVLSDDERLTLIKAVCEAVTVPVLAGTTTNDTRHSIELTSQAAALGAAGVLAVTPYYNRPPQAGLFAHFKAVAQSTSLPVMLYDIPARTGRKISVETIVGLSQECPNIIGVKDASGDLAAAAQTIAQTPPTFDLYSGDDSLTLAFLDIGGVGVVSVASHWVGDMMQAVIGAFLSGDQEKVTELESVLSVSYDFESTERWPNPLPTKAVLRALGLNVGQCRLPMGPSDPDLDLAATALITQLGLLGA
ncbi:MAG: 4-hydroxy-tetrahydrodipicolinate synthase [Actinomycetes bacterium]|jgi:4-hydroxy-tetrahydrodipicolinate synthase